MVWQERRHKARILVRSTLEFIKWEFFTMFTSRWLVSTARKSRFTDCYFLMIVHISESRIKNRGYGSPRKKFYCSPADDIYSVIMTKKPFSTRYSYLPMPLPVKIVSRPHRPGKHTSVELNLTTDCQVWGSSNSQRKKGRSCRVLLLLADPPSRIGKSH